MNKNAEIYIKNIIEGVTDYFFKPISRLFFGSHQIKNISDLEEYIRKHSSHVTQQTLYEYVKTRMGTRYVKMFDDESFMKSLHISSWNIYAVSLQDLTLFSYSFLKHLHKDFNKENIFAMYEKIITADLANGLPDEIRTKRIEEFKKRLEEVDLNNYYLNNPFFQSSKALYDWAPIADELKVLDKEIVMNSMQLKWNNIMSDFAKILRM
jgi:hypothetical protein